MLETHYLTKEVAFSKIPVIADVYENEFKLHNGKN